MSQDIREYYQDADNCKADIHAARKAFGNKNTTRSQYDQMEKTLLLMLIHAPEELTSIIESTIYEAEQRRIYFEPLWGKE